MKAHLTQLLAEALQSVHPESGDIGIHLDRPKQSQHGDFATNLALQLAKPLRQNPREVAGRLIAALPASPFVERTEIAGAGFINFFLKPGARQQIVARILDQGEHFGKGEPKPGRLQVEYVSANPTGPLHVGHGRGAAYGASLVNLLRAAGFKVDAEYYVNDAGRQMDILALSTWLRYLEAVGQTLRFPPNAYQGDYVRDMAASLLQQVGDRLNRPVGDVFADVTEVEDDKERHLDDLIARAKALLDNDYRVVLQHALTTQLDDCRQDLEEFGVRFDRWFSEQSLFDSSLIKRAIDTLAAHDHLYQKDGALWFRSTAFGDEKDRVVQRENGIYTYFASDIAYHLDKYERGYDLIINVWGADHHGYIPRVKGAIAALGLEPARLEIALVQFAVLWRGSEKAAMSTRSGEFVTLRALREEVGNDAARFFYVLRKSDQHLDFDLELAKSQKNENPVYYIQYAHARIASVLRQWGGDAAMLLEGADLSLLVESHEQALLQRLEEFPELIESAARERAPHQVAYYLKDLAAELHSYYNAQQFLVPEEALKLARLALVYATQHVLRNGLTLLGVSSPDIM